MPRTADICPGLPPTRYAGSSIDHEFSGSPAKVRDPSVRWPAAVTAQRLHRHKLVATQVCRALRQTHVAGIGCPAAAARRCSCTRGENRCLLRCLSLFVMHSVDKHCLPLPSAQSRPVAESLSRNVSDMMVALMCMSATLTCASAVTQSYGLHCCLVAAC